MIIRVLVVLVFFIAPISVQSSELMDKMTRQERFYLKEFFKDAICSDQWGYSLFFDKPVSLTGFFLRCPSNELIAPYRDKLMKKGWRVLKKYQEHISTKNYLLCEELYRFFPTEYSQEIIIRHIYLVNKQAFIKVLYENKSLFKARLGEDFVPEKLLLAIEETKTLTPHLNHDEALIGIVLGFGTESSLHFNECHVQEVQSPLWDQLLQGVNSDRPEKCKIHPVEFVGNPCSIEVQNILKHYSSQITAIWEIYKDRRFIEVVLERFSDNYN